MVYALLFYVISVWFTKLMPISGGCVIPILAYYRAELLHFLY